MATVVTRISENEIEIRTPREDQLERKTTEELLDDETELVASLQRVQAKLDLVREHLITANTGVIERPE